MCLETTEERRFRHDTTGVYPGENWKKAEAEQVVLQRPKLEELRSLVGGRIYVVWNGFMVYQ